jgi:NADPH:quinone reductase-like Zn-dependent oxidoreductase
MKMTSTASQSGKELRSLVSAGGTLQLSLLDVPLGELGANQGLIRVEASPINPSDLGLLFVGADMTIATVSGTADDPVVTAPIAEGVMRALSVRVGISMPAGNEGAGTVVAAGSSPEAQRLMGKTVAAAGGGMYAQYRAVDASLCMELPAGTSARMGASSFVNPLTALGMVETMRQEGYAALVHTAAASNLGQMLNKLCIEEGIALVNIVRRPAQEQILKAIGASYVCDSSSPTFMSDLIAALRATSATLAFDAIGGGKLAGQILTAMEAAALDSSRPYSRYGSTTHKQVYIYGGLDQSPTILNRSFGFAWGVGGWLLTPFLQAAGPEKLMALRQRVVDGLGTTFSSTYNKDVSLAEMLQPQSFLVYAKQATGEKFLVTPSLDS